MTGPEHGAALQEDGSLDSDLGEITQASLRGRAQGVWVHLQALLRASPQAALWVSATPKHNSQSKAESLCLSSFSVCSPTRLPPDANFNMSNTCICPSAARASYLGKILTHMLMSQSLRASAFIFCLLKSWNHHKCWLHSAPPPKHGVTAQGILFMKKLFIQVLHRKLYDQDVLLQTRASGNPKAFDSLLIILWYLDVVTKLRINICHPF